MAATSQNAPQDRVSAAQPKLRLRYGRLSVAVVGLLAVLATVVTGILAPFTGIGFGLVLLCLGVGIASFATLRTLAVRDRNRNLLVRMEQIRRQAMDTPAFADASNQVIARPERDEQVFDARPDSGRRAPSITADELRAEALRVARGAGGVQQPATWAPTEVPKPQYVTVREASEKTRDLVAKQVRPEPLPVAEPLRPSAKISLKASEEAKEIANRVSENEKAAVAQLESARQGAKVEQVPADGVPAAPVAETPEQGASTTKAPEPNLPEAAPTAKDQAVESSKQRLNLDAVLQRRRA